MSNTNQFNKSNDAEIREKALKKLYELSLKSLAKKAQLDKPSYEQEQWLKRKMQGGFS